MNAGHADVREIDLVKIERAAVEPVVVAVGAATFVAVVVRVAADAVVAVLTAGAAFAVVVPVTAAPAAVVVVAVAALIARPSESLTLLSPPFLQSAFSPDLSVGHGYPSPLTCKVPFARLKVFAKVLLLLCTCWASLDTPASG